MSLSSKIDPVIKVYRGVISAQKQAFWLFLVVNIFFGGLGVWLPPVLATQDPRVSAWKEFIKALQQGNGYLFALAISTTSTSYLALEYLDEKKTDFRQIKLLAGILVLVSVILMAILLSESISSGFATIMSSNESTTNTIQLLTEGVFTILSVFAAAFLFCLERIDEYPEYGKELKDRKTKLINQAGSICEPGMKL